MYFAIKRYRPGVRRLTSARIFLRLAQFIMGWAIYGKKKLFFLYCLFVSKSNEILYGQDFIVDAEKCQTEFL